MELLVRKLFAMPVCAIKTVCKHTSLKESPTDLTVPFSKKTLASWSRKITSVVAKFAIKYKLEFNLKNHYSREW
jgi:hypothetical protein